MRFSESERTEVKFALPRADLGKLETILEVNCRRVSYRNRTSRVVSLYFDDHRLSACRENVDGSSRRAKLRLRWYDEPFPRGDLFLEIKRRRGQATSKERHSLPLATALESVAIRETAMALSRALPEAAAEALLARPEAIVIVEYERSYFEAKSESLRITLDSDLVFYSQVGHLRPSRRFPVHARDVVILEAKTSVASEDRMRELLHPLEPRVTRSSKYVLGCQAIGLLPGTHYGEI
ncbi:MAG TPA: polyphosphate polymerase domain-containing protein [Vicinamibacteria bacterium]|nr:polyphosphate polymerase domain-containing protein [Vicinamibacteria bacterium]